MPPRAALQLASRDLGERAAIFSWSLDGRRLAACGSKGVVYVLARSGKLQDQVVVADAAPQPSAFPVAVAAVEVRLQATSVLHALSMSWPGRASCRTRWLWQMRLPSPAPSLWQWLP